MDQPNWIEQLPKIDVSDRWDAAGSRKAFVFPCLTHDPSRYGEKVWCISIREANGTDVIWPQREYPTEQEAIDRVVALGFTYPDRGAAVRESWAARYTN